MEIKPWHRHYDYNVPTTMRYPGIPAQNLFHVAASQFPKKPAATIYGSEITFSQLREQALRMANALAGLGIKKGDRVAIALPNCPQYIISYLAVLSTGAAIVNMNPQYTHDELKFMMETTAIEGLITFDGALPTIRPLALEIGLKHVIVTKVSDYIKGSGMSRAKRINIEKGWRHFSELIESCDDKRIPRVKISPEDPALIQFTGGTTGLPKGAVLTHANVVSATLMCPQWGMAISDFTPRQISNVLSIIPYFHIYGNIVAMNWAFMTGSTQILLPRFEIEEFFDTVEKQEQITFFPAVPTMITAIVNHSRSEKLNLGERIRLLNSGGAPMPTELIQKVRDIGIFFGEGYGMSESTALGISNPILGVSKAGSIGVPYIDFDVRLVDVETGTEDVKPGEPGEILLKSPTIMQGYWKNPEETRNQTKDGWLHTGDIAQTDEDGYFYIVDRKKDMIIAGGFNIYPREIDEVLYQNPKVHEAVSVGIPDSYRGETVKAFIVLKPGQSATDKEIIEFCKAKLAPYKVPKQVEFREALPKSAVGKILRKMMRDEEVAKQKKQ